MGEEFLLYQTRTHGHFYFMNSLFWIGDARRYEILWRRFVKTA